MKRLLLSFLIPVLAFTLSTDVMANALVKHVFGVHGLSCAFCVIGVKRTFKKVKGVHSIAVSLKHSTVTVYTKKGVCFSKKELKRLFGKAGFTYHGTLVRPRSCGKLS